MVNFWVFKDDESESEAKTNSGPRVYPLLVESPHFACVEHAQCPFLAHHVSTYTYTHTHTHTHTHTYAHTRTRAWLVVPRLSSGQGSRHFAITVFTFRQSSPSTNNCNHGSRVGYLSMSQRMRLKEISADSMYFHKNFPKEFWKNIENISREFWRKCKEIWKELFQEMSGRPQRNLCGSL